MSGPNHVSQQSRQFSSPENEGQEELSGLSMSPPAFSISASGSTPPPAGGGNRGEAPIQRQVIQRQAYRSQSSMQSVGILQTLGSGDNTAAMRAVVRGINQTLQRRTESGGEFNLVCRGGGDSFNLWLTEEDARIMRDQLHQRAAHLAGQARESGFQSGGRGDAHTNSFTRAFNREFRRILPALREADGAISGEADPRNPEFTTLELNELFTPPQRSKIAGFIGSRNVPDRLFTNADNGGANAQQRILIASHILAHGRIRRGQFDQRVHGRMCGHWVELVHNYAGAGFTEGRGIENNFDHDGRGGMGTGRMEREYLGDRQNLSEEERTGSHRRFRREPMPFSRFGSIQPGDWVYVFTDTNTMGGDHSGIFSHWAGAEGNENGIRYRAAVIFSQRNPDSGGTEDTWYLSDQDGTVRNHRLHTVSRVARQQGDAQMPGTVAEVETNDLGVRGGRRSGHIASRNDRYIRRHGRRGNPVDRNLLIREIQRINQNIINQLIQAGRVSDSDIMMWEETNRGNDLEVLVRLNERMNNMFQGSTTLNRSMAAEHERVDQRRVDAQAEANANRIEYADQLERLEDDIENFERANGFRTQATALRRQRTPLYRRRRGIRNRLQQTRNMERRREMVRQIGEITTQIDNLTTRIEEAEREMNTAWEYARENEDRWHVGADRNLVQHLNRLRGRRDTIQSQITVQDEAGGYHFSHPGRRPDFRGENTGRARLTGLVENVRPQLNWDSLRHPTGGENQ